LSHPSKTIEVYDTQGNNA